MIDLTPAGMAQSKRAHTMAIGDTDYQQWRHHPITAAYLQFLDDQIEYMRTAAADLLENGLLTPGDRHQDRNPDVLRGQIVMLRQIHGLTLEQMQEFYRQDQSGDDHNDTD